MTKLISLLAILFGMVCAAAQEVVVENYATGVDIWLLLPYDLFLIGTNETAATYQISTQITDSKGKQAAVNEQQIHLPRKAWLQGTAIPILQSYPLPVDSYQLNLTLRNRSLGDRRNYSRNFSVGTQKTEIGQAYVIAEREGIQYMPGNLQLKDLDHLKLKQSFSIPVHQIRLQIDAQTIDFDYPQSPWELDILSIATQDSLHSLKVNITQDNIRYSMDALIYKAWFAFDARYSLKDQLAQLRYIATQNEWQVLRKVPEAKLGYAIESFWQANDPSPGTLRNEFREKFYSLVLYADEHYTIHKRLKGWKSDRGRIYIKFGEPEQIITDAFPIGQPPSIKWHYYRLNRVFVFTDERGFGQYTLRNKDEEYPDL